MENQTKLVSRKKHPERVCISEDSLTRLEGWLRELESHKKGSRITKSDLINFLILSHLPSLSEPEIESITKQHFDEVRFMEWALKRLKEAKTQGKELSLSDVIGLGVDQKQKGNKGDLQ